MWHEAKTFNPRLWFVLLFSVSVLMAQSEQGPRVTGGLQEPRPGFVVTLPPGPMAEKAAIACTECHEARIIVQQRLSKAAWTKEVDKMIKWGAVVDANDHDALIDFLSINFGVDQPPYAAPRTASDKTHATKSK